MKLLSEAVRASFGVRALALLLFAAVGLILPTQSLASEADIVLHFTQGDYIYLMLSGGFGLLAIAVAWILRAKLMAASPGNEKMREVGSAIREGAMAYLSRQVRTMLLFVVALGIGLFFLFQGQFGTMVGMWIAVAFVAGVAASYIAGYAGMMMAVEANMRTANAALTSYARALEIGFRAGGVAGLLTVGMGLIGATAILWLGGADAMKILVGFGFGGSLAALFMRVGGGIFTKAADVGADLVGKVEAGIPEDDPRNPATIADNVGDNVGDCAGMAADIFESYEVTLVAAIILGAATSAIFDQSTWMRLVLFALMARGLGIVASIIGIYSVKGTDDIDADPLQRIRKGFYSSAGVAALLTAGLAWYMMGGYGNNPIQTNQLTSVEQLRFAQNKKIAAAQASFATSKGIPIWKVKPSDIVGDPLLADFEYQPNPGLNEKMAKEQQLQGVLGNPDAFLEREPKSLTGYTPLTLESESPALDYAVNKIPTTEADQQTAANAPLITVREALATAKDLKVFRIKATITPPAGTPGAPPKPSTTEFLTGPYLKSHVDSIIKAAGTQAKFEVLEEIPVKLYVNADDELAIGVEGKTEKASLMQRAPIFGMYYKAPAKDINDTNTANLTAQFDQRQATPPGKQIPLAMATHATVPWYLFFFAIGFGLLMAFAIEALTDYYVSTHKRPVQEVAGVSSAGPAPMIIQGFAYAAESSVFMVFAIVFALLFPLFLFSPAIYGGYILSFYGIALVGLGLLTTTGYVLAMDTFGPISDNAQGVFEMSGAGQESERGSKAVQRLDAAGNTTKALTKGFAIATAVVAAVALFHTYLESAQLGTIGLRLDIPEIFLGLLIGGAAPYLFSAFAINAVGRASFQLINEVRAQFRNDPGIMQGTSKPNYGRCVAIVTAAAQKELLGPGILAIALPLAVAFGFSIGKPPTEIGGQLYNLTGAQALGGFLAGAILSGQLMAVLLANSGGMWDNAKKLIEDGLYGGKGTEAHKAGVVCDTVGDPFKDTAGPALNPLIKVMNLVALLLAPTIIMPYPDTVLITITVIAVAALAFSIYFSKKGSMSDSLQAAQQQGGKAADHQLPTHELPHAPEAAVRRKITVGDATADSEMDEPKG